MRSRVPLEALRLSAGVIEGHLAEQQAGKRGLLGKKPIVLTKDGQQVLQAGCAIRNACLAPGGDCVELVVGNEKQQVSLVLGVGEYGADTHAGSDGDLARRGFVVSLFHEQLAGRFANALKLFKLVLFALTEVTEEEFEFAWCPVPLRPN